MHEQTEGVVVAGPQAVRQLGDYIREQRRSSDISLRQLAKLAGVSNPYLSQIERGLRKPSAEILQQIAKALRISAEALYIQAGILDLREDHGLVVDAVLADDGLTERQKQVLLEIYDSFRKENATSLPAAADAAVVSVVTAPETDVVELAEGLGGAEPAAPATARAGRRRTATSTARKRTAPQTTDSAQPDAPGGTS
jgi:transcriptional regulator with XRE-family HTH domain